MSSFAQISPPAGGRLFSSLDGVRVLTADDASDVRQAVTDPLEFAGAGGPDRVESRASEHRASVLGAGFQYHVEKLLGLRELVGIVAILALKDEMS